MFQRHLWFCPLPFESTHTLKPPYSLLYEALGIQRSAFSFSFFAKCGPLLLTYHSLSPQPSNPLFRVSQPFQDILCMFTDFRGGGANFPWSLGKFYRDSDLPDAAGLGGGGPHGHLPMPDLRIGENLLDGFDGCYAGVFFHQKVNPLLLRLGEKDLGHFFF